MNCTKKAMAGAWHGILTMIVVLLAMLNPVHAAEVPASLSIDPLATLDESRVGMIVTGTYNCGPIEPPLIIQSGPQLTVTVTQAAGREIASGSAVVIVDPVTCDGSNQSFSFNVGSQNIPWRGGHARVFGDLFMQVFDPDTFTAFNVEANTTVTVSVRRHSK